MGEFYLVLKLTRLGGLGVLPTGPFIITNFTSTPPRFFNNLLRKYRKDWKEEYNKTNVALCNKEPDKPLTMLSLILFWLLVNPVYHFQKKYFSH